jgi:hypothetical protein
MALRCWLANSMSRTRITSSAAAAEDPTMV